MKRIDERTVELTDEEMEVRTHFDDLCAVGFSVEVAARVALIRHPSMERDFIEYLSDGTLTLTHGVVTTTVTA